MPIREEQLAKGEAQRKAQNQEIPTLIDAMRESFERKSRSFGDTVVALENRITATVADPSLYPSRIAKVARIAAANDKAYEDLTKMLDAIQKKFGKEPANAIARGKYFNTAVADWLKRHPPDSGTTP